ncbi:RpiB/LacA/LacB family sugar-phosphate isomerase [Candidatus Uhrbacteria bacterium]|nr:RpiB/LacA/LacB family sugar-phosphate isomerase [Candidatus Uhrbacteria bacterium]
MLKQAIRAHLEERPDVEVVDLGTDSAESVDYPKYALPVAEAVARLGPAGRGILVCGTGIGMCIAANKVPGIRAALAYDDLTVQMSREHNDANILALGARTASGNVGIATRLVDLWLATSFSGGENHVRRLAQIGERDGSCVDLSPTVVSELGD